MRPNTLPVTCLKLSMPPPPLLSVTGEVYCFLRRQLIFSFGRRVVYHSKGLWEYIPKSTPSVCTTIFKRIAELCFHPKFFMLNINGFISTSSTNKSFFFQISNFFPIYGRKPKNIQTNSEAWILIKVQCVIYQWICLNELYKLRKSFFQISFWNFWLKIENFGRKRKNIQKNSKA